ncbi:MAG: T9SS type A sorting domain-containing protein, partial [Flavobacteriaceae bacterium]|nr:T9SS type A sorting domain-containing protein [Flavobacteriaceae bacterium]
PLDLEAVQAEDAINDLDKSLPWRYGVERVINLDLENNGVWTQLETGGRIWQAAIRSVDAVNMSVNFDYFRLPAGSSLHLYNADRTDISRTYTQSENTPNARLGSWFVEGDVIIVEYYEPETTEQTASLEIGSVIHGYRMGEVRNYLGMEGRGLNDSGDCHYDVNCSVGEDFDVQKDMLKKAVALLNLGNGFLCSSVLLNTTNNDKKPYLLTANHCLENSNPEFWSVRFNWMSPNPICGEAIDSQDIASNFTMSGAQLRANHSASDFALVELVNPIPNSWDVTFAGWDRTDALPEYEIGIHHPNGDIMKICRDDSGATKSVAGSTEVWLIGGTSAGSGNGWEIGSTASGSSGSPLFDQKGHIIGQLYAGEAYCDGTSSNNEYDIYGRFGVSWDRGETAATRLKEWLDPQNTGQTTVDMLQNSLSVPDIELAGQLDIYPNPATTSISIMNTRYPNLEYSFYNIMGQVLTSGSFATTINELNVAGYAEGIYLLRLLDRDSNKEITKKIVITR